MIQVFLFLIPFAFGLFYEFTAYFAQIFLLVILSLILVKRKKIKIYLNFSSISLMCIALGYLMACIYAIDSGMAFLGFLKFTLPLTFMIILMQYRKEHINKIISVIPISGIVMIALSIIFKYISFLPDEFYLPNGRMAGFFQYSNTFALFLLIGIIISVNSQKSNFKKSLIISILLLGILASGSRLIFLLTLLNFMIFIIKFKNLRKYLIGIIGIGILITLIYTGITSDFNTFGRYLTTSLESSTLLGRVLYYKDAILQIISNPLGIGYMGYSYIQPSIQTGIYTAIYVHNDFLQLLLDIGIIPTIIFAIALIESLINKNEFDVKKQILLTIILHMLFDFDLQFLCIFLILVLTLNLSAGKKYIHKINKIASISLISISIVIYLYFGICTFLQYINKSEIAIKMYPIYTEANLSLLYESSEKNIEDANKIANNILKKNTSISVVYDVKAIYYLQNRNWKSMIENKQKSLEINKYDINNYEEYILMLSNAIEYYINNDDVNNAKYCINLVLEVPSKIKEVENTTSDIAYKLNDLPSFELSEEIKNYIENIKGVL